MTAADASDIDTFVAKQVESQISKCVFADLGNEIDLCSEAGATDRLIRSLSTEVDSVPRTKQRFARSGNARDLHGEASGVASNYDDAMRQRNLRVTGSQNSMALPF